MGFITAMGPFMAFSLPWADGGLYIIAMGLYHCHGVLYGFTTVVDVWALYGLSLPCMGALYGFIIAMGPLYGFIIVMGALCGFITVWRPLRLYYCNGAPLWLYNCSGALYGFIIAMGALCGFIIGMGAICSLMWLYDV